MAAAGVGDGDYRLGQVSTSTVRDGVARGPAGVLAGSTLTMVDAVRNLHALGVPLPDALDAATRVPARAGGLPASAHSAKAGPADVVVLDDRLEIHTVMVAGEVPADH